MPTSSGVQASHSQTLTSWKRWPFHSSLGTPNAVRAYAREKHLFPQFEYLICTRAELRRVWKAWHVLAVETKPDLVDHIAYTALIDTKGNERVLYDSSVHATQVVHDLRVLMG